MDFRFDCPQFVDFEKIPTPDDSWFNRQVKDQHEDKVGNGNHKENHQAKCRPEEQKGNGSYSEMVDTNEVKSAHRKSHPMKTRQDVLKKTKGDYESMAEKVVKFFHKTPDRFKNPSKGQPFRVPLAPIPNTYPVTPHFETDRRIRGVDNVKSKEDLEKEELEAMKKAQFRANPLKHRLGRSASCRRPGEADSRSKAEVARSVVERLTKVRDRPIKEEDAPKTTVNKRRIGCRTNPQSPALQTKKRAMLIPGSRSTSESESSGHGPEKYYHPPPRFESAFQPKLKHQTTKPIPFSFEGRDREKRDKKEARIQEMVEEERQMAAKFRAQPLPPDSPVGIPEKQVRSPTQPQEFCFQSDIRGSNYKTKFAMSQEANDEFRRQQAKFKARPAEVLKKTPFEPQKPSRFIEGDIGPSLATETRAETRRMFETQILNREKEIEEERNREREEQKLREIKEAKDLRSKTVHKAQPVRHFKNVEIHPSEKNPTIPQSPKFSRRFNK